jgi:hypothetical protein
VIIPDDEHAHRTDDKRQLRRCFSSPSLDERPTLGHAIEAMRSDARARENQTHSSSEIQKHGTEEGVVGFPESMTV